MEDFFISCALIIGNESMPPDKKVALLQDEINSLRERITATEEEQYIPSTLEGLTFDDALDGLKFL